MAGAVASAHVFSPFPIAGTVCQAGFLEPGLFAMFPLPAVLWLIVGPPAAGIAMLVVLTVPVWTASALQVLPLAALAGYVLALPVSIALARHIAAAPDGKRRI
jgi:hypothetical protein